MYFGDFKNLKDVVSRFEIDESELTDAKVLAAVYEGGAYDGAAMVVFYKDGKLYEVHGSHCSCNGLEGCWTPEETSCDALMFRIENGQMGSYFGEEFIEALKRSLVDEIFDKEVLEN